MSIPKIIQSFEPFPFSGCNLVETCRRPGSLQANIGTLCQKSDPDLISTPQISKAEANQLTPLWQLRSFCRKGFVRSFLQKNPWIWVKNRSIYTVDQYNWQDTWSSKMYLLRVLSKNGKHLCYSFCLVSFTKIFMSFFLVRLGLHNFVQRKSPWVSTMQEEMSGQELRQQLEALMGTTTEPASFDLWLGTVNFCHSQTKQVQKIWLAPRWLLYTILYIVLI